MHGEIKFTKETAHKSAGKWRWSKGLAILAMDTLREPSPNDTKVVNLSPIGKNGLSGTEIELPVGQLSEIVTEMMKLAGIDIVEFAKNTLVANGYVRLFWSKEDIVELARQDNRRELTDAEVDEIAHQLANNDCEDGISWQAIRAITLAVCPDAVSMDREDFYDDSDNEDDESDGIDLGKSAWDIVENNFTPNQY